MILLKLNVIRRQAVPVDCIQDCQCFLRPLDLTCPVIVKVSFSKMKEVIIAFAHKEPASFSFFLPLHHLLLCQFPLHFMEVEKSINSETMPSHARTSSSAATMALRRSAGHLFDLPSPSLPSLSPPSIGYISIESLQTFIHLHHLRSFNSNYYTLFRIRASSSVPLVPTRK